MSVTAIGNPTPPGATLPNLSSHSSGAILSWVQTEPVPHEAVAADAGNSDPGTSDPGTTAQNTAPTHSLRMTRLDVHGNSSDVFTVAQGRDWFLNWADFPSVYALDDQRLAAHWLRRSGQSTYAYDVVTSRSDDGVQWTEPQVPHLDGTQTEHGFVSFFARNGQPALAWLDGRSTKPSGGGHADHSTASAQNAMTLRTRSLDHASSGERYTIASELLDARVCDCCQTSAVNTDQGAIVFYRNRSDDEIRDIAFVRYDESSDSWSKPAMVFEDGWKINGCPVNGPQADARGPVVAVAWFTAVPTPRVQVAVSSDSGKTFGEPLLISDSAPLGRVSLVLLDTQRILISWLEREEADSALLKARLLDVNLKQLADADVSHLSASRRSGFARLAALSDRSAMIVWTEWNEELGSVRTARIDVR